jgi:signal transduction histidine kinase
VALAFARAPERSIGWAQAGLLIAGPVLLALLYRWPRYAAIAVVAVDIAYVLMGFPFLAIVPSTLIAVVGPIGRARREAYLRWQEEERLRREAEAQREQEQERRRAADERVRIAQELHDILAHSLSLINVRASVALELPEEVRPALLAIKQASRDGLAEVRSVLASLHPEGAPAPRTPAPDLSRLDDLVGQASAAGLEVAVQTVGTRRALPAAVELAAYRIVQEGLTNIMRHSEARTATVVLQYGERQLLLGVGDPGPAQRKPDGHDGGRGVIGLQERAASLGGYAIAGSDGLGGFMVMAALPAVVAR